LIPTTPDFQFQKKFDLIEERRYIKIEFKIMAQRSKQKLNLEVVSLKKEVQLLRSALIYFLGKDAEGEYNPKFVKKILKALKERPVGKFTSKKDFLKLIA